MTLDGIQQRIRDRKTAFGNVKLFIERDDRALPEFVPTEVVATKHIPGSSETIVQHLGFLPSVAQFTVHVASRDDFAELLALIGNTRTLTMSDMATALDVPREYMLDEVYANIPNVRLIAITEPVSYDTGRRRCVVTFERGG